MKIKIELGNIINYEVDAVVNAANQQLMAGGGVCGAIFKAAGYDVLSKECRSIGYCPTGSAVITSGYNLKAKYIIHAVGPIYKDETSAKYLKSCYESILRIADEYNLKTIAIPSISTGIYGYPKEQAAFIAYNTIKEYKTTNIEEVILVCFDKETFDIYGRLL